MARAVPGIDPRSLPNLLLVFEDVGYSSAGKLESGAGAKHWGLIIYRF